MGQQEVLDYLAEHPGVQMNAVQIAEALGCSPSAVRACIKRLMKSNDVLWKNSNKGPNLYKYWVN